MGAAYQPIAMENRLTANELRDSAWDFGEFVVPKGVLYLIANIDTQKWKWVVDVQGVGVDNQRWIIDRFDVTDSERKTDDNDGLAFVQPATYAEDWDRITDAVLRKRYPLADGTGTMAIHHTVCDMQGVDGVTENAYRYAKKLKYEMGLGESFTLLRGERPNPRTNQPLIRVAELDKTSRSAVNARVVGKLTFVRVNTTVAKDVVAGQLRRTEQGANYINFSKYLPDEVYGECTVEVRLDKGWDNPLRKRNEEWDLLAYGIVNIKIIAQRLHGKQLNWSNPPTFALPWSENSNVVLTQQDPNTKKQATQQSKVDKLLQLRGQTR